MQRRACFQGRSLSPRSRSLFLFCLSRCQRMITCHFQVPKEQVYKSTFGKYRICSQLFGSTLAWIRFFLEMVDRINPSSFWFLPNETRPSERGGVSCRVRSEIGERIRSAQGLLWAQNRGWTRIFGFASSSLSVLGL